MKYNLFLLVIASFLIVSCSSSQDGSLFGDLKQAECTDDNCSSQVASPEPSFERDDNSDTILGKFDNTLELSGKCRLKNVSDSEIQIKITSENGQQKTLTDGFLPIVGTTSATSPVAKCERGRWAIAISACNSLIGTAGVHKIDLTLRGKDKNNRLVEIQDGKIAMNLIRSSDCDISVQ